MFGICVRNCALIRFYIRPTDIIACRKAEGAALLHELLKFVGPYIAPLLGGGFAGAILTEWYRRKHSRLQRIPLIERVNRLVSTPPQGGITLARAIGEPAHRKLVELNNLREYQLTLRNTSTVQLQNVEIQFDFPAKDVQEYASPRTTLSKTSLLKVGAVPTDATTFPTVFRWRIPHLPSGDSVEFTFQAVDPPSKSFVVALYNSDRVIVEKVEGDPGPAKKSDAWKMLLVILGSLVFVVTLLLIGRVPPVLQFPESFTMVKEGGCDLRVASTYNRIEEGSEIRVIQHRIFNAGQSCVVKSDQLDPKGPFTVGAGEIVKRERLAQFRPKLVQTEVSVGATNTAPKKTFIPLYTEP